MPVINPDETRITIPAELMEYFQKQPQILIKIKAPGLWPVPIDILKNPKLLEKLVNSKELQLVAMPR